MFVVIGQCNVDICTAPEHRFVCENEASEQILTESQAKELKEELDNLYSKDYHYKIARLTYLD